MSAPIELEEALAENAAQLACNAAAARILRDYLDRIEAMSARARELSARTDALLEACR